MALVNSGNNTPLFFWLTLGLIILAAFIWTACQKYNALCYDHVKFRISGDTVYVDDLECGIPDMYSPEDEVPAEEAYVDHFALVEICDTLM